MNIKKIMCLRLSPKKRQTCIDLCRKKHLQQIFNWTYTLVPFDQTRPPELKYTTFRKCSSLTLKTHKTSNSVRQSTIITTRCVFFVLTDYMEKHKFLWCLYVPCVYLCSLHLFRHYVCSVFATDYKYLRYILLYLKVKTRSATKGNVPWNCKRFMDEMSVKLHFNYIY